MPRLKSFGIKNQSKMLSNRRRQRGRSSHLKGMTAKRKTSTVTEQWCQLSFKTPINISRISVIIQSKLLIPTYMPTNFPILPVDY
jgi:hypothetical protein